MLTSTSVTINLSKYFLSLNSLVLNQETKPIMKIKMNMLDQIFSILIRKQTLAAIVTVFTCFSCSSKKEETVLIKKNGLVEEVSINPLYSEDELRSATVRVLQIPSSGEVPINREGIIIFKYDVTIANLNNYAFYATFEGPVLRLQPHNSSSGTVSTLAFNAPSNSYGLSMLRLMQTGVGEKFDVCYFEGAKIESSEVELAVRKLFGDDNGKFITNEIRKSINADSK